MLWQVLQLLQKQIVVSSAFLLGLSQYLVCLFLKIEKTKNLLLNIILWASCGAIGDQLFADFSSTVACN